MLLEPNPTFPGEPRPTELTKLIPFDEHVEEFRNLYCDHYDGCLDEAVDKCWTSWTCAECLLFTSSGCTEQELTRLAEARVPQPIREPWTDGVSGL